MPQSNNNFKSIPDVAANNLLKEMIGSVMYFSNMTEYSALVEEKLQALSGWDMVKFIEFSISRGCFVSREISSFYHNRRNLDFYSSDSPLIRQLHESHSIVVRELKGNSLQEKYEKNLQKEGYNFIYLFPVIVREKFVGLLACYSKSDTPAEESALSLIELTGEILAIAQETLFCRKKLEEFHKTINDYEETFIELESVKILGELSSGTAFEINNLLTGILGNIELLERYEKNPVTKNLIADIKSSTIIGRESIKNLQEFKKLDIKEDYTTVELDSLLKKAVELTRSKWREESWARSIEYKIEMDFRQNPLVTGSPSSLTGAFVMAIFKAIESIPDGGKINISTDKCEELAVIRIESIKNPSAQSSMGMFDPFFQTADSPDTGSNISAAKKIIKLHQGEMTYETRITSGITITIKLPVLKSSGDEKEVKISPQETMIGNILVVEDDITVLKLVQNVLEVEGFKVKIAQTGDAALKILKENPIDILMTDLGMPGMSGYQLASKAREINPDIPIILATGWESRIDKNKIQQNNINYIVGKPFLFSELFDVINQLLKKV